MPRSYFNKFNRGEVDENVMARDDVERIADSASLMENWMPLRIGPMMYRPGTEYLGAAKVNGSHYLIPFVDDGENPTFLELSQSTADPSVESVRFWVNDALTQTVATADTITNGSFTTDLSGWTADHSGAGAAVWEAQGRLQITGGAADADWGRLYQTVTRSAGRRSIRILNNTSPILVQIGTGGVQSNDLFEDYLGLGVHILTIEPLLDYTITIANDKPYMALVEECDHVAAGPLELTGPIVLDTTTLAQTLQTVRYTQVNDVCFITDGAYATEQVSYPFWMIKRRGLESWSFELPEQLDGPFGLINLTGVTLTPGALLGDTTLTASVDFFVDTGTNYRDQFQLIHSSVNGICEVVTVTSPTVAEVRVLKDFGAITATTDWQRGEFGRTTPGPTAAEIFEGRLWLAGGARLWGSVSDQYTSFDTDLTGDSAAISKTLGFGPVQDVAWLKGGDVMLLGLSSEEVEINSNGDQDIMSATNIRTRRGTNKGAAKIRPEVVDKVIYFIQRGLRKVFALSGLQGENVQASDTTLLHPEITAPGVKRMVYSSDPEPRMYVLLTDGELRVLLFDDTEEVIAWSRFKPAGGGTITDIAASPSTTEDAVMLLVDRGGVTYVEKLAKFSQSLGGADSRHYDSHRKYTSPGATITDLQHLEGERVYVWADGVERQTAVVASGAITLSQSGWTDVVVGLRHVARWRSNKIARYVDETVLNYRKRIVQIGMVMRSVALRTIRYGPDENTLDSIPEVDGGRARAPTTEPEPTIVDSITGDLPVQDLALEGDVLYAATTTTAAAVRGSGTPVAFTSAASNFLSATFDPISNKVVIAYADGGNSNYGTVVVGTVSGSFVSFGAPVVFESANIDNISVVFDSLNSKVVIAYRDNGNSGYGTAIVGTVGGTTISFGTPAVFESAQTLAISTGFDSFNNKVVIAYRDNGNSNYGTAIVGTVAGTDISFGTPVVFESIYNGAPGVTAITFDSFSNRVVIFYESNEASQRGKAIVGTVSGTTISFGTSEYFGEGTDFDDLSPVFDPVNNKVVVAYRSVYPSSVLGNTMSAVVGTVSGTSISFGTRADLDEGPDQTAITAVFDSFSNKVVIAYRRGVADAFRGTVTMGTVSGTDIIFDTEVALDGTAWKSDYSSAVFDTVTNTVVIAYRDNSVLRGEVVALGTGALGAFRAIDVSSYDAMTDLSVLNLDSDNNQHVFGYQTVTGTPAVFESADASHHASAFDPVNNKVVIAYKDNGNSGYATAVVGTVSGTDISFGTPVVFAGLPWSIHEPASIVFDPVTNKVVIVYLNGQTGDGYAIVGTVSGTSISFGTSVIFEVAATSGIAATFDSTNNKVVIAYTVSSLGYAIVGTVSGTSISFGTRVVFNAIAGTFNTGITFDSFNNKVVIVHRTASLSTLAVVGTVSGTSISFGTPVVFNNANSIYISPVFDSNLNKVVIAYRDGGNLEYGTAVVGTVSGTSISFGTPVVFESSSVSYTSATFDSLNNTVCVFYADDGNSNYGTVVVGAVSGTDISFGTPVVYESAAVSWQAATFDSLNNKSVIAYADGGNSSYGTAVVIKDGDEILDTNLSGSQIAVGTPAVFEFGNAVGCSAAFDSVNNKVVIAYADIGNGYTYTAVVGTVSGTGISFGTPVVIENVGSTGSNHIVAVYDSLNNKVVIAYNDPDGGGAGVYNGKAIVGTVSGTTISFGTPAVFESARCNNLASTFDSTDNKVVIAYADVGNLNYGTAIVGTVAGTTISFGTAVVFESGSSNNIGATFDSNLNKVVIAYRDDGNSSYGTAVVGTVAGTGISFGTPVVHRSSLTNLSTPVFDSLNNKVVIAYRDGGNSFYGTAVVGTVSGTTISFGTPVVFESATTDWLGGTFDSTSSTVIFSYADAGNSSYGTAVTGAVSGTDISFGTPVVFQSSNTLFTSATFDSLNNKVVIGYQATAYGTATVLRSTYVYSATDDLRAFGIIADGNYAYLVVREDDVTPSASRERGVAVVDITVPASPTQTAYLSSSSVAAGVNPARAIVKQGGHLFVPGHHVAGELAAIDVSNPAAPTLEANSLALTYTTNPPAPDRIALYSSYLYVAWEDDLHIVDVSDPTNISLVSVTTVGGNNTQCIVDGVWLYLLAPDTGTVSAYDLAVATAPALVGTLTASSLIGTEDMTAFTPWLYTVGGTSGNVVDFRAPEAPVLYATYTGFVGINAIAATQPNLFFAGGDDGAGDGTIYSADQRSWLYVDYDEMSFVFNGTYDTDARAYLEATGPATILAMTMEIEDIDEPNNGSDAIGDYEYNQRTSRYTLPQE